MNEILHSTSSPLSGIIHVPCYSNFSSLYYWVPVFRNEGDSWYPMYGNDGDHRCFWVFTSPKLKGGSPSLLCHKTYPHFLCVYRIVQRTKIVDRGCSRLRDYNSTNVTGLSDRYRGLKKCILCRLLIGSSWILDPSSSCIFRKEDEEDE